MMTTLRSKERARNNFRSYARQSVDWYDVHGLATVATMKCDTCSLANTRWLVRAIVVACCMMPSLATSMEHVRLRRDGREQVIHGRVIVEAQDGGLLVLDQAHVLWTVMPDELIDRQQDAAPFESLDHKVLSSELLKQLPAGFKVHKTTHYLICYNTSQAYAKWCGSLLESLYKGFRNYWRKQQFELTDPDWPLVAIVLAAGNRLDHGLLQFDHQPSEHVRLDRSRWSAVPSTQCAGTHSSDSFPARSRANGGDDRS